MAYDDRPMYEINNQATPRKKAEPKRGCKSASTPSPVYCWLEEENKKKREGKFNEIDKNEMQAALRGARNKWHKVALKSRQLVQDFLDSLKGKTKDYAKAKQMWIELKELQSK